MGVNNNYPKLPLNLQLAFRDGPPGWAGSNTRNSKAFVQMINRTIDGKTNNCGELSLRAGHATTTEDNLLCNENSVVILTPVTANAAAEAGAGSLYVVANDGFFTINHVNDANADKTFRYIIVG